MKPTSYLKKILFLNMRRVNKDYDIDQTVSANNANNKQ